jgi:uncharacterized protein
MPLPPYATDTADGLELRLKIVPGASRNRVVGLLGDRLKLQVAAPPEDGKANKAVIACLATWLGVSKQAVTLRSGHSQPQKTVLIPGDTPLPDLNPPSR